MGAWRHWVVLISVLVTAPSDSIRTAELQCTDFPQRLQLRAQRHDYANAFPKSASIPEYVWKAFQQYNTTKALGPKQTGLYADACVLVCHM